MDYVDEVFTDQVVELDGNLFKNCTFEGCILRYRGGFVDMRQPLFLDRNRFEFLDGVDPNDNPVLNFFKAAVIRNGGQVGVKPNTANNPHITPKKDLG